MKRALGWNNFHNEPSVARRLRDLVGSYGNVPSQLMRRYVGTVVYVFLTNGHGVAREADPIYRELIGRFDSEQAAFALRSFADTTISSWLQHELPRTKWAELLDLLTPKLTGRRDRALLGTVRGFNGPPDRLVMDSDIKRQLAQWSSRNKARRSGAKAKYQGAAEADAALHTLLTGYLHAYSPATSQHFAKWLSIPGGAPSSCSTRWQPTEAGQAGWRAGLDGGRQHDCPECLASGCSAGPHAIYARIIQQLRPLEGEVTRNVQVVVVGRSLEDHAGMPTADDLDPATDARPSTPR